LNEPDAGRPVSPSAVNFSEGGTWKSTKKLLKFIKKPWLESVEQETSTRNDLREELDVDAEGLPVVDGSKQLPNNRI